MAAGENFCCAATYFAVFVIGETEVGYGEQLKVVSGFSAWGAVLSLEISAG